MESKSWAKAMEQNSRIPQQLNQIWGNLPRYDKKVSESDNDSVRCQNRALGLMLSNASGLSSCLHCQVCHLQMDQSDHRSIDPKGGE